MSKELIKKKLRLKSPLMTIMVIVLAIAFIFPQVVAISPTLLNTSEKNIQIKTYKSSISAEPIWFIKPVLKKMYIGDKSEFGLFGNRSIIIGSITLQVGTETQNQLISVKYHFMDLNNTSIGQDVEIDWSEQYPNFNYFYAIKHSPFSSAYPSKFKIVATAQFIGIPYASTNITVFKIF